MNGPLRIGVSASFFHPDPERNIFKGKRLLYAEEMLIHWIMRAGALPVLIPTSHAGFSPERIMAELDGLALQGGSDVSPESYGETPLRPEWAGDRFRDIYEQQLIQASMRLDRPVLGVCRGLQILNVALGGSLYQDIGEQQPDARVHRDGEIYDGLRHSIDFTEGSELREIYGAARGDVISIHHQAIRELAPGLRIEARSSEDGIIEAIRLVEPPPFLHAAQNNGAGVAETPYAYGVQWHPEFQTDAPEDAGLLDAGAVLGRFLDAAAGRRAKRMDASAVS